MINHFSRSVWIIEWLLCCLDQGVVFLIRLGLISPGNSRRRCSRKSTVTVRSRGAEGKSPMYRKSRANQGSRPWFTGGRKNSSSQSPAQWRWRLSAPTYSTCWPVIRDCPTDLCKCSPDTKLRWITTPQVRLEGDSHLPRLWRTSRQGAPHHSGVCDLRPANYCTREARKRGVLWENHPITSSGNGGRETKEAVHLTLSLWLTLGTLQEPGHPFAETSQ